MKNITYHDGYCHPPERSKTALLVDDDPLMRELLEAILSSRGYEVSVAEDGAQALVLARQHGFDAFDLLFTDVWMPGMNGVELEKEIRLVQPQIKAIFTSGYSVRELAARDCDLGGRVFVHKPFHLHCIDTAIDSLEVRVLAAA